MQYPDGLETTRLHTRFLQPEDATVWVSYFDDPINSTFIDNPNNLPNGERTKEWLDFCFKRYKENRLGLQALIEKESGEFVGTCGLLIQEVNGKQEVEIGYHLLRKHWGRGYATEAAQMFRDYGFENNFADSIISIIHPLNFPSKNVAIRNGMTLSEKGISFREKEYDVFRISRQEWQQLKA